MKTSKQIEHPNLTKISKTDKDIKHKKRLYKYFIKWHCLQKQAQSAKLEKRIKLRNSIKGLLYDFKKVKVWIAIFNENLFSLTKGT